MIAWLSFPQDLGEAATAQLDAALCAALAAAGHLVATCPAHRLPVLYAGMLLLEASPRGVPCFTRVVCNCLPGPKTSPANARLRAHVILPFSMVVLPLYC